MEHTHNTPAAGWQGFRQSWRNDMLAGFSVSMVSLPLALGLALASGVPPMAGLISALVAGLVTTFLRGSHIAVNGPGYALIAVFLMAMSSLKDGTGQAFSYVLAAIVCAGILQVGLALLRLGRLGESIPSAVIHGILAAIGLILIGKEIHLALGTTSEAHTTLGILLEVPQSLLAANPAVALVAVVSLLLLVSHSRWKNKLVRLVPAPMWVLLVTIPMAAWLSFDTAHQYTLLGATYSVGPQHLVQLPGNLLDSLVFPNFAKIGTWPFWSVVLSITLLSSIETLVSAKAIDKLDPYKRATDLNRELLGVGVSTALAGLLGGLPVATVISRSSVNIHNHAKTRWSNFFQGAFLLLFVVFLTPVIQRVPMAALAALLVYTGYKLTAPRVFREAAKKGWEQLLFLLITLGATLWLGFVGGLVIGAAFVFVFHQIRLGMAPHQFFRTLRRPLWKIRPARSGKIEASISGVVNFANVLWLRSKLNALPRQQEVLLDFSEALLVDLTVLESVTEFAEKYRRDGGTFSLEGLASHQASASYPCALRVAGGGGRVGKVEPSVRPSRRQRELKALAVQQGWTFQMELNWNASYLKNFQFFETRPLEYKENVLSGTYEAHDVSWEISDLTFDEGALLVEEYHTTALVLHTPAPLPAFVVEREELYDRLMEAMGQEDIDFRYFTKFSKKFVVKGKADEVELLEALFAPSLIRFLESHDIYHLECNGEALLVFRKFRLERPQGIMEMHQFSQELLETLFPGRARENREQQGCEQEGKKAQRGRPGTTNPILVTR